MKKMHPVRFQEVEITNGFWKSRQDLNANTTIYAVKNRFEETGRFAVYQGHWREGMPHRPYLFLTGDIEKWIESVAYLLRKGKCPELEEVCDAVIDLVERNQYPDGYYNMYVSQIEPTNRWNIRDLHELYAIGHMIEAAVAYYEATGKDKYLRCACRAADHAYQVFVVEHSAAFITPGHPEVELALVKLYRCTGEKRYLELCRFFVEERGKHPEVNNKYQYDENYYTPYGTQSHLPVREQETAEGHAVRACYLYSGMADLAYECEDKELRDVCRRIFDNISTRRMYISGGVGSDRQGESFTIDYDLPNLRAYSESCAAIALMLFARRMQLLEVNAKYADVIERILYNGFLSSTSLTGNAFFYENPLEFDPKMCTRNPGVTKQEPLAITQRVADFYTSCCPPNITRTMASIGDYLYTYDEETVYVHQYMDNVTQIKSGCETIKITQCTNYPVSGEVRISAQGLGKRRLAVRIPGWCDKWSITAAQKPVCYEQKDGYVYLEAGVNDVELSFDMTPYAVEASPHVHADAGRIAIMRGPVVYCVEAVDNGEDLRDLHIDFTQPLTVEGLDFCGLPTLQACGWRRDPNAFGDRLYRRVGTDRIAQTIKLIPYFACANRGETEMIVWILPA